MVLRPLCRPLGLLLLPLALSCGGPLAAAEAPANAAPAAAEPTSTPTPAATSSDKTPTASPTPTGTPTATPTPGPSSREQQVLERIRQLKAPRWRSFGACRYDWSGWRLSEAGVRATASECGEPAVASGIAVHCESLRVARRNGEGPWEPWRLPLANEESKSLGGEDRMVASLCANVTTPAAPAGGKATPPQPLKTPPALPAGSGAGSKNRTKTS